MKSPINLIWWDEKTKQVKVGSITLEQYYKEQREIPEDKERDSKDNRTAD
jgi:hypothetical protein